MGRHLKPISDRKPAKKLALKLRELKGDIPFARLAKAVHVKPNTLSTMADGTFRGWRCVEQFLDAVEKCGGTVTAQDRSECRAYHKIADQLHRERTGVGSPHSVHISAPALQIDTVVLAPRVAEEGVDEVVTFTHTESTVACPSSLARCRNQHDIVIALIDLVLDQKMDLQSWRHRTTFPGASRRTRAPEWQVLTGQRPPTLPIVLSIVRECGGEPRDLNRWEQQWNRIMSPGNRYVGIAQAPERSVTSEAMVAMADNEPVNDEDLRRIRDCLIAVSAGVQMPPPGLWRRIVARAQMHRKLTRRSPGRAHPGGDRAPDGR